VRLGAKNVSRFGSAWVAGKGPVAAYSSALSEIRRPFLRLTRWIQVQEHSAVNRPRVTMPATALAPQMTKFAGMTNASAMSSP
jgi:hypothetical protein